MCVKTPLVVGSDSETDMGMVPLALMAKYRWGALLRKHVMLFVVLPKNMSWIEALESWRHG